MSHRTKATYQLILNYIDENTYDLHPAIYDDVDTLTEKTWKPLRNQEIIDTGHAKTGLRVLETRGEETKIIKL